MEDEREHTDNELILEMFLLDTVVNLKRAVKVELGVDVAVEALFVKVDTFAGLCLEGGVQYPCWAGQGFDFGGIETILVTCLVLAMV